MGLFENSSQAVAIWGKWCSHPIQAQRAIQSIPSGNFTVIAIEHSHLVRWFSHKRWWFSSSQNVNVYQRVDPNQIPLNHINPIKWWFSRLMWVYQRLITIDLLPSGNQPGGLLENLRTTNAPLVIMGWFSSKPRGWLPVNRMTLQVG
jgi:hypothetical protein